MKQERYLLQFNEHFEAFQINRYELPWLTYNVLIKIIKKTIADISKTMAQKTNKKSR